MKGLRVKTVNKIGKDAYLMGNYSVVGYFFGNFIVKVVMLFLKPLLFLFKWTLIICFFPISIPILLFKKR